MNKILSRGYILLLAFAVAAVLAAEIYYMSMRLEPAPPARKPLGAAQLADRGWSELDARNYEKALASFEEALRLDPALADAHNGIGWTLVQTDEPKAAIPKFDKAIELNPGLAEAYNNRGVARRMAHDMKGALADFDKALNIDPKHVFAILNRAYIHAAEGRRDAAFADFELALKINPQSAEAYCDRGYARLFEDADSDQALADFNKALELNPANDETLLGRGLLFFNEGKFHAAAADFRAALARNARNPYAALWLYLASMHADGAGKEELEKYFDSTLKGKAKERKAAAQILMQLGRIGPEECLSRCGSPNDPESDLDGRCEACFQIGESLLLKGDAAQARDYFKKSVSTRRRNFLEFQASEAELRRLDGKRTEPQANP